ncbi:MAG: hypothetical protein AB8I80_07965, partial [Anaerolineae bacterium]
AVGEALRRAKQRYVTELGFGGLGEYEEKSLIEATLYGLPMTRVDLPRTISPHSVPQRTVDVGSGSGGSGFSLAAYSGTPVVMPLAPMLNTTTDGQYYDIGGEIQASAGRPLQPRTSVELVPSMSGYEIHGVLLWTASFTKTAGFDPVIYRPVTDTALSEPPFSYEGWYQSQFWSLNTLGDETRLVVVGGQYLSDDTTTGTERLFGEVTFQAYSSSSSDYGTPAIRSVEATPGENSVTIEAEVSDAETSVDQVWLTYETSPGWWETFPMDYKEDTGLWTLEVSNPLDPFEFFVQAVDEGGNVAVSNDKGSFFTAGGGEIFLPVVLREYP